MKITAKEIVSEMTVEEAASQLRYASPAIKRLNIPAYNWWNEALHGVARAGVATVFPQAIGMAASFDPDLLYDVADAISVEARTKYDSFQSMGDYGQYKGLTFWSPNINIFRDPRWGRGQETYGEDPYLTSVMGTAFVKGLQGDEPGHLKAAACAKHFAVHSGPESKRHSFDAVASDKDMNETYLPAFKALVRAGVAGFMGAYNRVNGEPACASPILQKILRKDWRFDGYFTSDCWAINDFHNGHHVTENAAQSAALALKNGCDLNCGDAYEHILEALRLNLISENDIRRCAERLIDIRLRLGILPWQDSTDKQLDVSSVCRKKHKNLNIRMSRESLVLLKNDGILPLRRNQISNIAVIGPNADSVAALVGNYNGIPDEYYTVLTGIREVHHEADVIYAKGCSLDKEDITDEPGSGIPEAVIAALNADVSVICVGFDESLEGEEGLNRTGDRNNLLLPAAQRKLIRRIASAGKPFIVVNMTGCCIDFEDITETAPAIIQAWYPGALGGKAIAEMIFGDFNPSGKLPVTFYRNTDAIPDFEDYSMRGRTYRYIDYDPLYKFGFGLSYTSYEGCFENGKTKFPIFEAPESVKVRITNTGKRSGRSVVKIYSKTDLSFSEPNPVLCGIKSIFLDPGETKDTDILLSSRVFTAISACGDVIKASKAELSIEL